MRDMPAGFSKDMQRPDLFEICQDLPHTREQMSVSWYDDVRGEFLLPIIFFLEIFAQFFLVIFVCFAGLESGGKFLDFKLGQFNQVDLLFVLHEWSWRGLQILWLIPRVVKAENVFELSIPFILPSASAPTPPPAETLLSWLALQYKPSLMLGYRPSDQSEDNA